MAQQSAPTIERKWPHSQLAGTRPYLAFHSVNGSILLVPVVGVVVDLQSHQAFRGVFVALPLPSETLVSRCSNNRCIARQPRLGRHVMPPSPCLFHVSHRFEVALQIMPKRKTSGKGGAWSQRGGCEPTTAPERGASSATCWLSRSLHLDGETCSWDRGLGKQRGLWRRRNEVVGSGPTWPVHDCKGIA